VAELRSHVTAAERVQWTSKGAKDWANESFTITTSAAITYCVQQEHAYWFEPDNKALDSDEDKRVVAVDKAYREQHLPTVNQRLTHAGVHLGGLLNRALGGEWHKWAALCSRLRGSQSLTSSWSSTSMRF
jgi:hypothetical protein